MKEVEVDDVELVSEDTYETERVMLFFWKVKGTQVPRRVVTIGRPSDVVQETRWISCIRVLGF